MPEDPKPLPFLSLIHPYTGDVTGIRRAESGPGTDFAAVVECEKGAFFVKAMRNHGWRSASINRERLIIPYVEPISPALCWGAADEGWAVLGLEVAEGRRPDFEPGSPDLPTMVELVDRIGKVDLPDVARSWTETRWDRFLTRESEIGLLRGDALLHADINPYNLIVGDERSWAVDWAWPTRGAAFIDPAMFVVQLISSGHTPEGAETWASGCTAWREADPVAVDAFAAAYLRMRREMAERRPDTASRKAMLHAAATWVAHRGGDACPPPAAQVPGSGR
ncbi:hypothetical protein [Streptomyces sp. SBT349]|uniref:hypothetical protein n=1 Tax=Streptomyces sp. SBT349 TaxID=1580539 RepID=UPI0007C6D6E8|nr:hypothetical protein [Streptomyces sp. SBT349]